MLTFSNFLSFIRAPLALIFLQKNIPLRVIAIIIAMISDSVDGYFARRNKSTSKFGAVLDPAMDKFFVYFALVVLYFEGNVKLWEALFILSRDFALCIYGLYIVFFKKFSEFELRSLRWGKVITAMQFIILMGLTLNYHFSPVVYSLFIIFGILAFIELFQKKPFGKNFF
jgi:phosphatidylglycerophosphate synthase